MRQAGHKPGQRTRAGNAFPEAEDTRVEQRRTHAPPDPPQRHCYAEQSSGSEKHSMATAKYCKETRGNGTEWQ